MRFNASPTPRGNVLFIILLAVVLFAALIAAVTKSNQGTGNLEKERFKISATDLMGFASTIEKAVGRMISMGVSESQLDFSNSIWRLGDNTTNAMAANAACTTEDCRVFGAGGGVDAKNFASTVAVTATDVRSGDGGVYSLSIAGVGTAARDLVFMIHLIDSTACFEINKLANIPNATATPPSDAWTMPARFPEATGGGYGAAPTADEIIGDNATDLNGRTTGCVAKTGAGAPAGNYFYQVLLAR